MADDLDNMKKLAAVKVLSINLDTRERYIFTVRYIVVAEDETEMYSSKLTADMTDVNNIGSYTIAQLNAWAKAQAAKDAKKKWGK